MWTVWLEAIDYLSKIVNNVTLLQFGESLLSV